jgi:type III restriction enzyme
MISKYYPDFIVKLKSGKNLILEVKGIDDEKNKAKRSYLAEWLKAVNEQGGFGVWDSAVSYSPGDLANILKSNYSEIA